MSIVKRFLHIKLYNSTNIMTFIISEAQDNDIVISGWGLRDWRLVLKHKDSIIEYIFELK